MDQDTVTPIEITVSLSGKTKYTDYKIISFKKDTTLIDTTLTIAKEYKFNFLRKDLFGLLSFANQGQTFNQLTYNFNQLSSSPEMGITGKQFNYLKTEDINYYEVPTPSTEILYRTGMQQGQVLDVLFTLNFSRRLNVGIAYKGLRSLGNYRNSLASQGNFRTFFSYRSKNDRYALRGHIAKQDLLNQENGGLTTSAMNDFTTNDPNFKERGRLDVNLENTETVFDGNRLYLEHDFKLFVSRDSSQTKDFSNLKLGHAFRHETKNYEFIQPTINTDLFGSTSALSSINDQVESKRVDNKLYLEFNSKYILGTFRALANFSNYAYGYATDINPTVSPIASPKLRGSALGFGTSWQASIKQFQLNASLIVTPGSDLLSGNHFYTEALYTKSKELTLKASILLNSKAPNFNSILYQSSYDDYNWENSNFKNVNTRNLQVGVTSKWLEVSADFNHIENYTYFDENSKPVQAAENISYMKIKAQKEFTFGKFALDNTLLYQKVATGSDVFRVPDFVSRNTFYYTDYWFEGKPMKVQIGATLNYFSSYKANAFNPLLNEFYLQNNTDIGYPTIDVFFNAQVRRTRLFLKIDNVTSSFSDRNYMSAPNYPYRDFVIRFGLVWNWFI
ncbi:hypothetical protein GCM10011416_12070 [Polaribacter pacificus]|uniref:Porin n=2 Tax=Polaribacter pacificus TaxID=1775173 RepID=A0A917MCN6_9FLAO|nr:hypothetical protein GCM10011416_12070 [Polaribacter pacificus]